MNIISKELYCAICRYIEGEISDSEYLTPDLVDEIQVEDNETRVYYNPKSIMVSENKCHETDRYWDAENTHQLVHECEEFIWSLGGYVISIVPRWFGVGAFEVTIYRNSSLIFSCIESMNDYITKGIYEERPRVVFKYAEMIMNKKEK